MIVFLSSSAPVIFFLMAKFFISFHQSPLCLVDLLCKRIQKGV
nr:hypothetical protein [Mucilaginibacter kameinonensis]